MTRREDQSLGSATTSLGKQLDIEKYFDLYPIFQTTTSVSLQ